MVHDIGHFGNDSQPKLPAGMCESVHQALEIFFCEGSQVNCIIRVYVQQLTDEHRADLGFHAGQVK